MDLGLDGARALIGGGSGGLGGAIAAALTGEGARVALVARPSERLDAAVGRLAGAVAVPEDLSTPDGPGRAVRTAADALGGLDLLLVNSGGPPLGAFEDLDEAAWQQAIDGTLWSALRLIRAALPHLRASDRPAIAVILSSSAREPIPGLTTSNLIRPGLAGLIKSLTAEIAPIRINGIAPGRVATDRIAAFPPGIGTARRRERQIDTIVNRASLVNNLAHFGHLTPAREEAERFLAGRATASRSTAELGALADAQSGLALLHALRGEPDLSRQSYAAGLGETDAAVGHLARAVEIEPRYAEYAQTDEDLEAIRDAAGFPAAPAPA